MKRQELCVRHHVLAPKETETCAIPGCGFKIATRFSGFKVRTLRGQAVCLNCANTHAPELLRMVRWYAEGIVKDKGEEVPAELN